MKFWDASAIMPLCVEEPWTLWLSQVLAEDTLMVVWWGAWWSAGLPSRACGAKASFS